MFRFAQVYPEYTAALIGIFPVWDVQSIHLPSLKQAWALDDISLNCALNSRNPANRPDEIPDIPIVICHGLADKAVPIADHALKLAQKVPVSIHVTRDGHSTEAFDLYRTPLLVDVINDYVGL